MVEYLVKKKERETAIFEDSSDMIKFEHQEIEDVADFKEGITENGRTIDIFGRNAGWASHQDNRWAAKFVRENSGLITKAANEFDLSPDLLKAVVFTEMSRGWYDRIETGIVDFLPDFLPDSYIVETYLPGNVSKFWEPLIPGSDVRKKEDNLRLAAKLLKGIEKRLDHPHPEDVYSLYNGMAHDRTYENRKTKNTPFYLKVVLETKPGSMKTGAFTMPFPRRTDLRNRARSFGPGRRRRRRRWCRWRRRRCAKRSGGPCWDPLSRPLRRKIGRARWKVFYLQRTRTDQRSGRSARGVFTCCKSLSLRHRAGRRRPCG